MGGAGPRHDSQSPPSAQTLATPLRCQLASAPIDTAKIMPRFSDLDSDFVCPFRAGCPYLEGLSTAWVWDRYQKAVGLEAQYEHLLEESAKELAQTKRRLAEVEKERDQCKAQLHALQQSQFQKRKKPNPAPKAATPIPAKKKRGAPKGHPPWQRSKPTRIDRIVSVPAPTSCPHCQNQGIKSSPELHEHIQEDIVLEPRTVVTSFQHAQGWCPQCERLVWQSAPGELPGAYIGPVAKATATYLRYQLNVPYRKVSQFFRDFFGLPIKAIGRSG